MKELSLIFLLSLILYSCSPGLKVVLDGKTETLPKPPNMVQIDNNFFMDETEISNIDYKEYLYWIKKIHGTATQNAALPDTTVWQLNDSSYNQPYIELYFNHPAYSDYPVVGLTYEQAVAYSKWRSDRVFEVTLRQKDEQLASVLTNENYFSIERYFTGAIKGIQPDLSIAYPSFRLPTKAEWEKIASANTNDDYGINREKRVVKKAKKKGWKLFNIKNPSVKPFSITSPVRSYIVNDYGIYNMIGNVSEMVVEKGVSKGGSFDQELSVAKISNDIPYQTATRWLGFRNVCEYKYWKE